MVRHQIIRDWGAFEPMNYVVLKHLGKTDEEIAKIFDISPDTLELALKKKRKRIQTITTIIDLKSQHRSSKEIANAVGYSINKVYADTTRYRVKYKDFAN
jgi:predicted transcriptional regulator